MIVDCFPFFRELDLLELRLRTLDSVVDRFVIAEALTTHTGSPKPLYFADHRERFARWNDRIVHLVDGGEPVAEAWLNEWRQRDLLADGLAGLDPDDLVIMSDVDEIPTPESLRVRPANGELLVFEQELSYYAANFRHRDRCLGSRAFRAGDFARWGSMHAIRTITDAGTRVANGGWHFTFLGDRENARTKLLSTPHVEYGIPYYRDAARLDVLLAAGRNIADPDDALIWSPIDASYPAPMRADPERWRDFIADPPAAGVDVNARAHAHGSFAYVGADRDAVAVLTAAPERWQPSARERFGERFAGIATGGAELTALLHGRARPCVVVDGFERHHPPTLLARVRDELPAATLVAVTQNARTFAVLGEVIGGAPFPPGAALGAGEVESLCADAGFIIERTDKLPRPGFWLWTHALPETLGLQVGRVGIYEIPKDRIATFGALAYVTLARPR
jgi:hypothetical protein